MSTVTITMRFSAVTGSAALLILPDEGEAGPRKRDAEVKVTMPAWLAKDRGLT